MQNAPAGSRSNIIEFLREGFNTFPLLFYHLKPEIKKKLTAGLILDALLCKPGNYKTAAEKFNSAEKYTIQKATKIPMSKSEQGVIVIMFLLFFLYLAVWAVGYFTHRLAFFVPVLNIASWATVVGYWLIRQLQIQQHYIETREMVILGLELLILVLAIYTIISGTKLKWIVTAQYIFFSIHLLVLVAALIFMFTFKINKLM